MRIKLTAKQFDYRQGAGYARKVRGEVFDVDDATGKRLIRIDAAVLVEEGSGEANTSELDTEDPGETIPGGDSDVVEEIDSSIDEEPEDDTPESERPPKAANLAKWREYAKSLGIDTTNKTKDELIALVADR